MVIVIPAITDVYVRRRRKQGEEFGDRTNIIDMIPMFILGVLGTAIFRSIGDAASSRAEPRSVSGGRRRRTLSFMRLAPRLSTASR